MTSLNKARVEAWLSRIEPTLWIALEQRDPCTARHCKRVGWMAMMLATMLNVCASELAILSVAARFHDIGKIDVPDEVLLKASSLDAEEWRSMKSHSVRGEAMILAARELPSRVEIAQVIRYHHERYDGTGYPDGLRGQAIPFLSRILSVVDNYDAIRSRRTYHTARIHEEAISILASGRNTHYDPVILDAFLCHSKRWVISSDELQVDIEDKVATESSW